MTRFAIALSFLVLAPLSARAAAPDDDARAHFSAGVKAYDAKDYDGALREFRAADVAKPSVATKRNVGLALRALGRDGEAVAELESMLAMPAVPDDVRAKALRAIEEMRPRVAIVRVRVLARGAPPGASWRLQVDDATLAEARPARAIVSPGVHTFAAHVDGGGDGTRVVTVAAGEEREVTIDVAPAEASPPVAGLPAPSEANDASDAREPARATPLPPAPPPYAAERIASRAPPIDLRWYVRGGLALAGESRSFDKALDQASPTSRDLGGASLVARVGREMAPWWSVELLGELGVMTPATYASPYDPAVQADVHFTRASLVPMLRAHTLGRVRLTGATGIGVTFEQARAVFGESDGGLRTASGHGAGPAWIGEAGAEADLGKALLELGLFVEVHGLGSPTDDQGRSFFDDRASTRAGLRALVGWRL